MCGIGGIINLNHEAPAHSELKRMAGLMSSRGPDHEGIWIKDNVGFLHRRLSIIDLSELGNQPMIVDHGSLAITFNGEIYNFPALRSELEKLGLAFRTQTDTEVLLLGYKQWGIKMLLEKIDGMFAFCLADFNKQRFYLCRDRFGKKPLYYTFPGKRLVFASDIRAIAEVVSGLEPDFNSIDFYLSEISVPQPRTIWKNVWQVNPASWLEASFDGSDHKEQQYWSIRYGSPLDVSYEDAERMVERSLTEAIMKRTLSDVPLGAFLSGGVDSGLIVSLLAQNSSSRVKTFSVGFSEDDFNELPYARKLAGRYNTEHTEIVIEPQIGEVIYDMVDYFGEPFADSSCIPTYLICREMRKHVTVALSGDGGDEMFGYSNYAYMKRVDDFAKKYPSKPLRSLVTTLSKVGHRTGMSSTNYGSLNDAYDKSDTGIALIRGMAFMPEEKSLLYNSKFAGAAPGFTLAEVKRIWSKYDPASLADHIFLASLDTRLLNDYLVKVDRASMMSSLEVRSPFLDKDLAQLAFSLPVEYKLRNGQAKHLLKTLAVRHIDPEIFSRKKQGFGIPVKYWISNELRHIVNDTLSNESINRRGIFNAGYINTILKEHNGGAKDHTHKIWSLVWLELWFRRFVDKK